MKLSIKEVEHIAELARLGLSKKEKEKMAKELSSILDYVEELKKVPTEKVEPGGQTAGPVNVSRKDEIKEFKDREKLLDQAPAKENNYFKVKPVFDK